MQDKTYLDGSVESQNTKIVYFKCPWGCNAVHSDFFIFAIISSC
jgi:hypothetical protein